MKKILLGIFLLAGILSFAERRITIKSESYCTGYVGELGDDHPSTADGTDWEEYYFNKCVINGKTYYHNKNSEDYGLTLKVFFNYSSQRWNITQLINNSRKVYLKTGVTIEEYRKGSWGVNINKINMK